MPDETAAGLILRAERNLKHPKGAFRLVGMRPFNHNTGRANAADIGFAGYHTLTEDVDNLVLVYDNFHLSSNDDSHPIESNGNVLTLSASVRIYDGTGRYGPMYFARRNSLETKIAPRELIEFDPLNTGLILAGTNRLLLSTRVQCTLGNNIPTGTTTSSSYYSADGDGDVYLDAVDPASTVGSTGGAIYCPCMIGTYVPGGKRSGVLVLGDSIDAGTGKGSGTSPFGWIADKLEAGLVGYAYAPKSGDRASALANYVRSSGRMRLMSKVPVLFTGAIVNDVDAGRTAAQIKADLLTIWDRGKSAGVEEIWQKTCVPKTTGTWATPGNQTDAFAGAKQIVRGDVNEWLRSGQAKRDSDGALTGIFDVSALIEVNASDVLTEGGTFWKSGNTGDGLHPNDTGHSLFGTTITNGILSRWRTGFDLR